MSDKLPDGWRRAKLGEICREDRVSIGNSDPAYATMPYLGLEHIESNRGRILVSEDEARQSDSKSNNFRFTAEHVLYGKLRPYLNKVALPEFSGRCTTEIIPLLPVGTDRCWLAWLLRQEKVVEHAMRGKTGSRMPRTSMSEFLQLSVAVPPLDEQVRIVAQLEDQLTTAERARTAALAQLAAIEAMPQALLRQIFPRSPGSPLRRTWRWATLGEVCEINPRRPRNLDVAPSTLVTFIPMSAVSEKDAAIIQLTHRPYAEVSRGYTYMEDGDVIFAKITPCMQNGKHAIVRDTLTGFALGSTEFHVLRPSGEIDARLLHHFLLRAEFLREAQRNFTGTAGQQRVPPEFVSSSQFPLPPIDEQRRIVRELDEQTAAIERARAAVQAQLDAIDTLLTAALRLAFTP